MCKFIGKSNERILCKLSKSEILRLYSIVHVAMETKKTSNSTCQPKSFISICFTCQVSAGEQQPFSCHDLANDIYWQNAKTVFSHLKLPCSCWYRDFLWVWRWWFVEKSGMFLTPNHLFFISFVSPHMQLTVKSLLPLPLNL